MDLSIVIPTYNEKENIAILLGQIFSVFKLSKINGEVIIVDDNSPDGTGEIAESLKEQYPTIKVIHRKGKLGLSSAVIEGWKIASGEVLGVMDADLSHPAEKIPELYNPIKDKEADFTIGSRYIKGGKIIGWGLYRKASSKIGTLFARIFTSVKDPMTGFFMIKKECIQEVNLDPKGFKILLEILIKGHYKKTKEIPITFTNRTKGRSKAGMKEAIYYFQNIYSYLKEDKKILGQFFSFAFVGLIGTFINIAILYMLTEMLGIYYILSAIFSFIIAATSNFILNKTWTFKEKLNERILNKYLQFFLVSLTALIVNLFFLYAFTEFLKIYYLISQVLAIGIALIINFLGNKIWTFSK